MKGKRVLLIMAFMLLLMGFSGGQPTAATTNNLDLTEECQAEIKAVIVNCANQCPHNLRCFIRCVINNYPACAL